MGGFSGITGMASPLHAWLFCHWSPHFRLAVPHRHCHFFTITPGRRMQLGCPACEAFSFLSLSQEEGRGHAFLAFHAAAIR